MDEVLRAVTADQRWYAFADLRLERHSQRVFRGDTEIHLPPLSRRMLLALVEAAPGVLTHEELVREVWLGRYASAETIMQRVKLLRRTLGDDAHTPRYIALVRSLGYHLIPPVEVVSSRQMPTEGWHSLWQRHRSRWWLAVAAVLLVTLGGLWWAKAWMPVSSNRYVEAASPAAGAVPEEARALYEQGQLHYHRRGEGDLDLAEARYLEAIAQAPNYAAPWVGLASLVHLRYVAGADQTFQEFAQQERELLQHALQLDPKLAVAHARMARLMWISGEPRETVDSHLQQALTLGGDDPMVLAMYAMDLHGRGNQAQALEIMERVVTLDPYSAVHRINLVSLYLYIGRLERAEQELTTLDALHPNIGLALEYARLRLLQRRPEEALDFLPDIEHAADRLSIRAMALYAGGDEERGRAHLGELLEMDHPYAYTRYVEARFFMGDRQSLLAHIATLYEQWSADPTLRAELNTASTDLLFTPFSQEADRNASRDDVVALFIRD